MIASSTFVPAPFHARRPGELRRSCAPREGIEEDLSDFTRRDSDGVAINRVRSRIGRSFSLPKRDALVRTIESRARTERRRTYQSP